MKGPHGPKRPVSLSFIILYCVAFTSKPNTRTIVYIASIYIYISVSRCEFPALQFSALHFSSIQGGIFDGKGIYLYNYFNPLSVI